MQKQLDLLVSAIYCRFRDRIAINLFRQIRNTRPKRQSVQLTFEYLLRALCLDCAFPGPVGKKVRPQPRSSLYDAWIRHLHHPRGCRVQLQRSLRDSLVLGNGRERIFPIGDLLPNDVRSTILVLEVKLTR